MLTGVLVAGLTGCGGKSKDTKKKGADRSLHVRLVGEALVKRLPVVDGDAVPRDCYVLSVTGREIKFESKVVLTLVDGRVPEQAKRDGAQGFFIDPLFRVLKIHRRKLQAARKAGEACVLIAADRDTPFRVVSEVLYTAGQAQVGDFRVAVNPPPAGELAVAGVPLSMPRLSALRMVGTKLPPQGALDDALSPMRRSGPLVRGSAEYRRTLAELTSVGGVGARPMAPPMTATGTMSHLSAFVMPPMLRGAIASRVRARIRARTFALKSCHQKALAKHPGLTGPARVSFMITKSGRTSNVQVTTKMPAAVQRCLLDKVKRWNLGKVPEPVFYSYNVLFSLKP